MKSIKEEIITEDIINKSKFINYLIPVSDLEVAKAKLEDIRKQYSDASHHCFAYIIGYNQEVQKYSDDGEPSKTAGLPILEVLKKNDLTNVLSITIRYYGGTKLGAGGLTRAYTKSCAESVALATFTSLTNYAHLSITISFDHIGHVEKYIRDQYELLNTTYDNFVNYTINIKSSEIEEFQNSVTEFTKGSAIFNTIKTYDIYK
jgi:uncharacterized YigZ family protein